MPIAARKVTKEKMADINYDNFLAQPRNGFATASLILGVISILTISTVILPLFLGSLGILFAVLSKKCRQNFQGPALTGYVTSLIGLITSGVLTIFLLVSGITLLRPENRDNLNKMYEQTYGISFDEYTEQFYGEDVTELLDNFYEMY